MISRSWLSFITIVLFISGALFLHKHILPLTSLHLVTFLCGVLVVPTLRLIISRITRPGNVQTQHEVPSSSIYGLDHGRLHVKLPLPMWMNMGFWDTDDTDEDYPKTLAEASRRLLSEVLKTAGFCRKRESTLRFLGTCPSKALLDVGFGCGDQTIYLMSPVEVRASDGEWWDYQKSVPEFHSYTGVTLDKKQYQYAQQRVHELQSFDLRRHERNIQRAQNTKLFCADAANPDSWDDELKYRLVSEFKQVQERWVLALDTLYHFSPSRWSLIEYTSRTLNASLMAFDLCLADEISLSNLILLRILTKLMGAPWENFVTQNQYRRKLTEAGYHGIIIKDISKQVFDPLVRFLEEQDRALHVIGYSLGPFYLAKWMFSWWARSGIVRGVIVVARQ